MKLYLRQVDTPFSLFPIGDDDRPIRSGMWAPGGHFWFRSRLLTGGRRFEPIWLTEPWFMLQLQEDGYRGMVASDAVADHRIQPHLLDKKALRARAVKTGKGYANIRLRCRKTTKQGRLLEKHPVACRVFCGLSLVRWALAYLRAECTATGELRFARKISALERMSNYAEMIRIARRVRREWHEGGLSG